MIYTSRIDSPLGEILLSGDEGGLTGLHFADDREATGRLEEAFFSQTVE